MCNYLKFPCKICAKNVSENVKAVQCDLCEPWVHAKCNNLNYHATPENNNDPEKVCSSKYYDIEEVANIEIPHKNKSLSLSHLNACSLNKRFDDLQHLLSCTKKNFDIIGISETRIARQTSLLNNLNLNNYSFEFTPTETSAGATLLYIANHLPYKFLKDLNIYKK